MPDHRKPEPWQTNAAGAFLSIGDVHVWALGKDRFRVQSPAGEEQVADFREARQRARELASERDD